MWNTEGTVTSTVLSAFSPGSREYDVDETVIEELEFHQQTVATDENTPLHLIREKELEISGRVLAAKRGADEVVAEARQKAAALITAAQDEARGISEIRRKDIRTELERQIASEKSAGDRSVDSLQETIGQRRDKAIAFVVDSVLGR